MFSCRMVGQDVGELLQVLAAALTPPNAMCMCQCFGFATQPMLSLLHIHTCLCLNCCLRTQTSMQRHNSPVSSQPNVTPTCFQVLDERAQQFHPFISQATNVAASAVKSTRTVFNVSNDGHMLLLRRIWTSVMAGQPFPGHDHSDWEKEFGFQGKLPQTDLRRMGIYALEQLA